VGRRSGMRSRPRSANSWSLHPAPGSAWASSTFPSAPVRLARPGVFGVPGFGVNRSTGSCNVADYATPDVPIAPLPMVAQAILDSLGQHAPAGSTPTSAALSAALDYAKGWAGIHLDRKVIVVLATDGAPTLCDSNIGDIANLAAAAAGGRRRSKHSSSASERRSPRSTASPAEVGPPGAPRGHHDQSGRTVSRGHQPVGEPRCRATSSSHPQRRRQARLREGQRDLHPRGDPNNSWSTRPPHRSAIPALSVGTTTNLTNPKKMRSPATCDAVSNTGGTVTSFSGCETIRVSPLTPTPITCATRKPPVKRMACEIVTRATRHPRSGSIPRRPLPVRPAPNSALS